jgi:SulP family sulfate permease
VIAIVRAWREGRLARNRWPKDAAAGVVVGIVALPLCMAFAIASGLAPEQGLYTGIVAGLLIALLGGSMVQVGGPTGAFIVVLLGIVADHGVGGLMMATVLAGVLLILLGVTGLGRVVRWIPHPVTMGFTAGIAVIIFVSQVPDFFGLAIEGSPREFVERVEAIARAAPTVDVGTVGIGVATLATILLFPRVTRRVPAPLVGMLVGTALYLVLRPPGAATIQTRFGGIPTGLPRIGIPDHPLSEIPALLGPAFTIAMLGALESLLSAVVADGMTGDRHDSNQELIGQGVANVVAPFFGGFAATGAIARTATNVRNGGRSPVAGAVHALVLLVVMLVFAPWAGPIPLACLSAILFLVAWNMSEIREVTRMLVAGSWSDRAVLLTTFGLTVFVDLVVAVQAGVVLAALLFMKHMSERFEVRSLFHAEEKPDPHHDLATSLPDEIRIYAIDGPFFFGVAQRFETTVAAVPRGVRIVIVRMWRVPYLDASGLHSLRRAVRGLRRSGVRVLLSGVAPQVRDALERDGLLAEVGDENVWSTLEEALAFARDLVAEQRAAARAR